ncbi:MAG: zinc ribbon domain-containing protein [Pseudomonadota bacterium]
MPIYEYRCKACDHTLEALQKINEEPLSYCSKCDQDALVKKVSAPAFRLSGSGWYETDFKSSNKKNLAGDVATADTSAAATASSPTTPEKGSTKSASTTSTPSTSSSTTSSE